MAGIDIFNIEPNKISRDLKGKFILIYGEAKSGKTSFSSLFLSLFSAHLSADIMPCQELKRLILIVGQISKRFVLS